MRILKTAILCALLLQGSGAFAGAGDLACQRTLTLDDGSSMTGDVALEVALYNASDATVPVWGPVLIDPMPVIDGRFDLVLGSANEPALTDAMAEECAFIEVTVDGMTLAPRKALAAVQRAEKCVEECADRCHASPEHG